MRNSESPGFTTYSSDAAAGAAVLAAAADFAGFGGRGFTVATDDFAGFAGVGLAACGVGGSGFTFPTVPRAGFRIDTAHHLFYAITASGTVAPGVELTFQ